jgi:hypothetical protein
MAGQICKILADINVFPKVTYHGDPNVSSLWDLRCLSLKTQANKRQVDQLARYLKELDRTICSKTKVPAEPAAPIDESTARPSSFSR